jgi:hypothetical protein
MIDIKNLPDISLNSKKRITNAFYVNLGSTQFAKKTSKMSHGANLMGNSGMKEKKMEDYKVNNRMLGKGGSNNTASLPQIVNKKSQRNDIDFISRNLKKYK